MRRHAKAPSALTHGRSTIAAVFALCLLGLLALAPAASATKYVDRIVAGGESSGSTEGLFNNGARGIAINDPAVADGTTDPLGTSTDGYVYVADRRNHRIQVFGPEDAFKFTFGRGVETGGDGAEVCDSSEVPCTAVSGVSGDDEEGEFNNPVGVAINQQTGDVYVRDGNNARVQQFTAAGQFIRAWGWDVTVGGGTGFEICSAGCKAGASGANGGQFASNSSGSGIAVDPSAPHHVFLADPGNRRIQEFEPDGDFVRLWGGDVIAEGQPGDLGSALLEICTSTAVGVCKAAPNDSGNFVNGFLASGGSGGPSPNDIAIDGASGILYAADGRNRGLTNIMRFDTDVNTSADLLLPAIRLDSVVANLSASNISTAPDALAFDPDSGNLLAVIEGSSAPLEVVELADPDGEAVHIDTHVPGSGLNAEDIALDPADGDLYLSVSNRLFAADDDGATPPADSFIRPATGIEAHSATLSGCVDPLGTSPFTASYRFQYSTDGVSWTDVAPAIDLGAAAIDCDDPANDVEATATGLLANTLYRFRIVTNRQFGNPDVPSAEGTFTTDALAPATITLPPARRTDSAALLAGTVNPHGADTSFRFEWGKTIAYGKEVPAFPGAGAGSGGSSEPQSRLIEGLEPDTTYHYRICAQSIKGSSCGTDQAFTTRPAFADFASRGYERVTPLGAVDPNTTYYSATKTMAPVAADGEALVFNGYGYEATLPGNPVGDPPQPGAVQSLLGRRSADGWQTKATFSRPAGTSVTPPVLYFFDSEGGHGVLPTSSGWLGEATPQPGTYLRDYETETNTLLYGATAPPAAATADLSHLVLESGPRLIPGVGPGNFVTKVYEWDEGELRLVSVDPSGTPFPQGSQIGGPKSPSSHDYGDLDAISDDGRNIFFSTPVGLSTMKIYRRTDGETTALVSPSKRTPVDPKGQKAKIYEGASADGDSVFFTSAEQLTDDANTGATRAGSDLYRYEISTDTLVDLSAEANTADGARVQRVLGVSEDGDYAYYVALGQVVAGKGSEGKPNVYAWHDDGSADGETRYVATLGDGKIDKASFVPNGGNNQDPILSLAYTPRSTVSENGETLIFGSSESLTGQSTRGHAQVYAYEAAAENGAGALSCVSCRPDGEASSGYALVSSVAYRTGESAVPRSVDGRDGKAVSADGRRVFFTSTDALLAGDQNEVEDVYLWEEGRLSLISSGNSTRGSFLVGASPSGNDVFFYTGEPLVGEDYGDGHDIYDYRVGGGLASQNQPPPGEPCQADECKPATEAPPAFTPPKDGGAGDGNFVFPVEVISPNAKARSKAARRGKLPIGVIANQTGRVTVKATKGKKVLGAGSKVIFKPGPTNVLLKLKPLARRMLKDRGRLSLAVQVSLAGESETINVNLRRAK